MKLDVNVFGIYDNEQSRLYFYIQLKKLLLESLDNELEVNQCNIHTVIATSDSIPQDQIKVINASFDDKDEENRNVSLSSQSGIINSEHCTNFQLCHEELTPINVKIKATDTNVIVNGFQLNNNIIPTIHLQFISDYGVCFNPKTARACSSFIEVDKESNTFSISFTFTVDGNIENLPELAKIESASYSILRLDSIELMNDWLYCHKHHHHHVQQETNNVVKAEPKPTILSNIEQIVYLLTSNDSPQLLLESIQDKDLSIYIEFQQKYLNSFETDHDNGDSLKGLSTLDDEISMNNTLSIQKKILVYFKIFANNRQLQNDNAKDSIEYICCDKDLLKQYRMSFTVEWFQIEHNLYELLTETLLSANRFIKKIPLKMDYLNCFDYSDKSEENDKKLNYLSMLNMFHFG